MKIGVFGGTFDPFTQAHYEIVNKVLNGKLVDKVIVIPTIVNYYRKDKDVLFTTDQRKHIIQKWFDSREDVILDFYEYDFLDWNIKQFQSDKILSNRRYFHMLTDIIHRYDVNEHNEYYTIVGADSWNHLATWYNWRELGKMSKFIVVSRDCQDLESYKYDENCYFDQPSHIIEIDRNAADISATKLREHLENACENMSVGPNGTPYNLYIDEIDDYKKNGKTYLDQEKELDAANKLSLGLEAIREEFIDGSTSSFIDTASRQEKLLAHTPIFDLVEVPEVEAGFRPVKVKSPDWVSIIVEKDGKFLMTKQLRFGLNREFEEFPCGMIEKDEDVIDAGLRELREETGYGILDKRNVHYLGKFAANPAFMSNYMHYLHVNLDWALYDKSVTSLDVHEHLTSYWVPKNDAKLNFCNSEGSSLMGCAWMLIMDNSIA